MPIQQLVIALGDRDPGTAQDACFDCGALAVTLADAADDPVLEPAPGETPLWPTVRLTALLPEGAAGESVAAAIAGALDLEPPEFTLQEVADRQWEREWLRDFRPLRFGRRLWVCPGGQAAPDGRALLDTLERHREAVCSRHAEGLVDAPGRDDARVERERTAVGRDRPATPGVDRRDLGSNEAVAGSRDEPPQRQPQVTGLLHARHELVHVGEPLEPGRAVEDGHGVLPTEAARRREACETGADDGNPHRC